MRTVRNGNLVCIVPNLSVLVLCMVSVQLSEDHVAFLLYIKNVFAVSEKGAVDNHVFQRVLFLIYVKIEFSFLMIL